MPNQQNTPKTYSDTGYSEFGAESIYMNNDCVYLGDALYVCIKDTNHLASAPVPPENEYWELLYNFNEEEETDSDAAEETPDTAPLLLPEDAEPFPPLAGEVTATVAPKKKGGKKK